MSADLLLVRGAPGVGKHVAVEHLRPHLSQGAVIDVEIFRTMFARSSAADRQQHVIAMQIARSAALQMLDHQVHPVVLVDTFTSGKLASFVGDLDRPYCIATLYMDPEVLRQRLLLRGANAREIESASMINAEIAVRRHEREKVIDATERDAASIAESLRRWLRRGSLPAPTA